MTTATTPAPVFHYITAEAEEAAARALLTAPVFEFVNGAARHGQAKERNELAWDNTVLFPQLPADVSTRDLSSVVLWAKATAPFAVAPVGLPAQVRDNADFLIAEACAEVGVPYVLPTMASAPLEEVAATKDLKSAFQLYWLKDAAKRMELVKRAEQAGCKAIIVTIDAPWRLGSYNEQWLEYRPNQDVKFANLAEGDKGEIDPSLSWEGVQQVAESVNIPVYVKGVLSPVQARRAVDHGAFGVIVSNHSGRQLDAAPATADVLPSVARSLKTRKRDVMADSGIRTGTDVLRALTLGASSVLVGRQVMYGLAANGAMGVIDVLKRYTTELDAAMACTGITTPTEAANLTPEMAGFTA